MVLKNRKLRKGKKNCLAGAVAAAGGEDRLTNLPECLIHHILSFLEIKYTVRTRALSKRWNCIFVSIPTLNLWGLRNMKAKKFMNTVDRILHLHDMSKIQKLLLEYCGWLIPSKVDLWISAAVMRNVEEFDLEWVSEAGGPFPMPLSLFTCQSLVTLKLDICSRMYLPKYISCPRLKHLELHEVVFSDEHNNEQLFSDCPVLEELMLENCYWSSMKNLCISAPALRILKIWGVDDCYRWDNSNGLQGCGLKIDAPNLVSLSYKCDLAKEQAISSFQALVDADLDFNFDKHVGDAIRRLYVIDFGAVASRFFQALSHVKCLSISDRVLRALSCVKDLKNHLPTFHHLKQLNVEREASTDEALFALLQSAPNLESLEFNKFISMYKRYGIEQDDGEDHDNHVNDDDGLDLDRMTTGCFLVHLKSFCFKVFSGQPRETCWLKLTLKNAEVLERMTVYYSPCTHYPNVKSEEKFMQEYPSLFAVSENCEFQIGSMDCPH